MIRSHHKKIQEGYIKRPLAVDSVDVAIAFPPGEAVGARHCWLPRHCWRQRRHPRRTQPRRKGCCGCGCKCDWCEWPIFKEWFYRIHTNKCLCHHFCGKVGWCLEALDCRFEFFVGNLWISGLFWCQIHDRISLFTKRSRQFGSTCFIISKFESKIKPSAFKIQPGWVEWWNVEW